MLQAIKYESWFVSKLLKVSLYARLYYKRYFDIYDAHQIFSWFCKLSWAKNVVYFPSLGSIVKSRRRKKTFCGLFFCKKVVKLHGPLFSIENLPRIYLQGLKYSVLFPIWFSAITTDVNFLDTYFNFAKEEMYFVRSLMKLSSLNCSLLNNIFFWTFW